MPDTSLILIFLSVDYLSSVILKAALISRFESSSNVYQISASMSICYLQRAKKVFDPSDTHVPKKRGRPAGSLNRATIEKHITKGSDESRPESRASNSGGGSNSTTITTTATVKPDQSGVCSVCHLQNKKGPNDRMVACRECSNKGTFC